MNLLTKPETKNHSRNLTKIHFLPTIKGYIYLRGWVKQAQGLGFNNAIGFREDQFLNVTRPRK